IFDSIPLAALVMLLGAVTTVDNERELWEIVVLALLLGALRRKSKTLYVLSGIAAGVTLFFSFDIGLYSISGALIFCGVRWPRHRSDGGGMAAALQIFGIAIGTAPFIAYLASKGGL